jgi:hypothetical protein
MMPPRCHCRSNSCRRRRCSSSSPLGGALPPPRLSRPSARRSGCCPDEDDDDDAAGAFAAAAIACLPAASRCAEACGMDPSGQGRRQIGQPATKKARAEGSGSGSWVCGGAKERGCAGGVFAVGSKVQGVRGSGRERCESRLAFSSGTWASEYRGCYLSFSCTHRQEGCHGGRSGVLDHAALLGGPGGLLPGPPAGKALTACSAAGAERISASALHFDPSPSPFPLSPMEGVEAWEPEQLPGVRGG